MNRLRIVRFSLVNAAYAANRIVICAAIPPIREQGPLALLVMSNIEFALTLIVILVTDTGSEFFARHLSPRFQALVPSLSIVHSQ